MEFAFAAICSIEEKETGASGSENRRTHKATLHPKHTSKRRSCQCFFCAFYAAATDTGCRDVIGMASTIEGV